MNVQQSLWTPAAGWADSPPKPNDRVQVALLFGGSPSMSQQPLDEVRQAYPGAHLLGCSTAGEICGVNVSDGCLVVTAVEFERTRVAAHQVELNGDDEQASRRAGEQLAAAIDHEGLRHLFVLSDGLQVNGSELVDGLVSGLPQGVSITGGLAGDGDRFEATSVLAGEGAFQPGTVGAVGLYGDSLRVGCGSQGGWDSFGPERRVTKSSGNVLYELDGRSALSLYKQYLGEHADGLPATGLLFPMEVRAEGALKPLVRTILAVDEQEQSMTFAGDIIEGSYARLMKANMDRLIDGAAGAARNGLTSLDQGMRGLGILISCVGRKMVLKQRIEEEVEAVQAVLGEGTALAGFYSYGELSPFTPEARCELHNQTMTITVLRED
jgi:hypothetical protein